jgi:succinoglycan biosynthesis transport protein ExoP
MTLHQFLLIVRARWRLSLAVTALMVALGLVLSAAMPRSYSAQTALLVDVRAPDPVAAAQGVTGVIAPSYMATQVDLIAGERVAQRVLQALDLANNAAWQARWQKATQGQGSYDDWLLETLRKGLDVRPARESHVIHIVYKAPEAKMAADVANAFAQAYVDTVLALRTEPARVYAQWFDEQVRSSRNQLEQAQARLSAYAQRVGLVSTDERLDHESTRLAELSSQLTAVQGQNTDAQSKRTARAETVAEAMQSPLVTTLRADVGRLEARQRELAVNLGPNHPQMQRLQSELAALRAQLQSETGRVGTAIDTSWTVGRERERELQAVLAAQKGRVMGINKQRDELNVFRRDVEAAQRAYDEVSKSASLTRLQSLSNQTNIMRLDSAAAPQRPAGASRTLIVLIATFGGGLLGIGLALWLELAHRRVRSSDDIVQVLDLPVLARFSGGRSAPTSPALPQFPRGSPQLALGHGSAT